MKKSYTIGTATNSDIQLKDKTSRTLHATNGYLQRPVPLTRFNGTDKNSKARRF
ncbi:MAG: hypothetical protein AB8F78_01610 [Saprospiraceae bacterium]